MKEDIIKRFIKNICNDFEDILFIGIEENKEALPYSIACINFIYELEEKGISANLNYFSDNLRDSLYEEIKKYIGR